MKSSENIALVKKSKNYCCRLGKSKISRPEVFFKKVLLKKFLIKLQAGALYFSFSYEIGKNFKNTFFAEYRGTAAPKYAHLSVFFFQTKVKNHNIAKFSNTGKQDISSYQT